MAEHSVKLPEPRSDDSEDVVWGLSTASALWARGERRDAIVWIRRAAEAAEAAGNPFRASELGMYLPELEKALASGASTLPVNMPAEEPAPVSDAAPISSFEIVVDAETPAPPVVLPPVQPLGPVVAVPVTAPAPAAAAPTTAAAPSGSTPKTMPPAGAETSSTPKTMPPPDAVSTSSASTSQAASSEQAAQGSKSTAASSEQAADDKRSIATRSEQAASGSKSTVTAPVSTGRQTPIPSAPRPQVSAPRPKTVAPPPVQAAAEAPNRTTPLPEEPAARGSAPPAEPAKEPAKKKAAVTRMPILDPWSDASALDAASRQRLRRKNAGDGGASRQRARPLLDDDEEDVITSAPPLAELLGKKHSGAHIVGGTGLAQAPPVPAAARTGQTMAPPPLPPGAKGAPPAAAARPPPLPPAVAAPTPMPPMVAPTPPPAAPVAPVSAKVPTPPPPAPAGPTSAKVPTPAPPPPAAAKTPSPTPPAPTKTPTQPPAPSAASSAAVKVPPPPQLPADEDWATPPPAPVASVPPPVAEAGPPSDVVPTAPRPIIARKAPTIPPAPKLPSGAAGKSPLRPPVPDEDEDGTARPRILTDTLPSGITLAALKQAEADAAAAKAKTKSSIPPPPAPRAAPTQAPPAPMSSTTAPRPTPMVPKPPPVLFGSGKLPPKRSTTPPPAAAIKPPAAPPRPLPETPAGGADAPRISNVELQALEPFAQLPEEVQRLLARTAILEDLAPGEARSAFGAVLVVAGDVRVCAVNLDVPAKLEGSRSFIAARGSLSEGVPLRIVGGENGATISRWPSETFDQTVDAHEHAQEVCRNGSDALQARVGLTLGALSEVDLDTRESMIARLEVRALEPDTIITEEDGPMPGLVFVVGGSVEILEGDPAAVVADIRPGELLFPEALWAGAAAPLWSRAGASGALLLVGDRKLALDFAESVPVVGELLSR